MGITSFISSHIKPNNARRLTSLSRHTPRQPFSDSFISQTDIISCSIKACYHSLRNLQILIFKKFRHYKLLHSMSTPKTTKGGHHHELSSNVTICKTPNPKSMSDGIKMQENTSPIHHSPRKLSALPTPPSSGTPQKRSRKQYGDRFIPSRDGTNLQAAFCIARDHILNPPSSSTTNKNNSVAKLRKIEDADQTFSLLLKYEIFGDHVPSSVACNGGSLGPSGVKNVPEPRAGLSGRGVTNSFLDTTPTTPKRSGRLSAPVTRNSNLLRYQSPNRTKTYTSSLATPPPSSSVGLKLPDKSMDLIFPELKPRAGTDLTDRPRSDPKDFEKTNQNFNLRTSSRKIAIHRNNACGKSGDSVQEPGVPASTQSTLPILAEPLDPTNAIYSLSPMRPESQRLLLQKKLEPRKVSNIPYRVLDAPGLIDDYYLNLLDWSSQNVIGVALQSSVYLWNARNKDVKKLLDIGANDFVTSVSWIKRGTHLAVGTNQGLVQIWDAERCKRVRTMTGHDMRTGALAWNEHILSSGSRDRTILHHDVRIPEHYVTRLTGHRQEVCGLQWNVGENKLASGGNDNKLLIWDGLNETPLHRFTDHTAAVKALAWSPHQRGLLASGCGTADRRIRFWNMTTGILVDEIVTESQVCSLAWSRTSSELVSTHGYSKNQVSLWRYPSLQQVASLTGHGCRVLYLALSPDGTSAVTGAGIGDETLRFWKLFDSTTSSQTKKSLPPAFLQKTFMQMR